SGAQRAASTPRSFASSAPHLSTTSVKTSRASCRVGSTLSSTASAKTAMEARSRRKRGGLLCAYGYTAGVQPQRAPLTILMWLARQYLQSLWTRSLRGKRTRIYSINLMRARHPSWFKQDLERLFGLLATGAIRPRLAERISFDQVAEAHRRLEAGGLRGKPVLCPGPPSRPGPGPPRPPPRRPTPPTPARAASQRHTV